MTAVHKGKVFELKDDKARVMYLSSRSLSSPIISVGSQKVSIGDTVAFSVFEDGTGIVLAVFK